MQKTPTRRRALWRLVSTVATAVACTLASPVLAQSSDYPSRPIELIVAYAPGGGTDLIGRLLARHLERHLGASVVVLNRPGAGGGIGFGELARAKPDGYTIGFLNTPNLLTIPIERKSNFHWSQFDLLGNLVDDPGGFSVHRNNKQGIDSLASLLEYAKQNPEAVTVGTTGKGSDDHLSMLLVEKATGAKLSHIPYKGAGEVRAAVTGQEIVVGAINIGEAMAFQKSGTPLLILGQMAKERSSLAPQTPTFKEQGMDIELASLRGVGAPKGLPEAVRKKLSDTIATIAADPEFQEQALALYAPLRYLSPADQAAELEQAEAGFRKLWEDMPWLD